MRDGFSNFKEKKRANRKKTYFIVVTPSNYVTQFIQIKW